MAAQSCSWHHEEHNAYQVGQGKEIIIRSSGIGGRGRNRTYNLSIKSRMLNNHNLLVVSGNTNDYGTIARRDICLRMVQVAQ
jgi:hypothetical protein